MPNGKPNILVIWGDDIGITNLSCYSDGLMGYRTPNIDRIANEGMRFTDSYGEQSCTAGRSSFISGQSVYRTGMSKVGMPGVDMGCPPRTRRSPSYSNRWATRPGSSARTTSATSTSICRPCTGSTSSSATCITSMPRRSRSIPTTPPRTGPLVANWRYRAESAIQGDREGLRRARRAKYGPVGKQTHRGHRAADRRSGWRPSTTRSPMPSSTTSSASTRRALRSSSG